ncbi:MAG: ATP-dependent helicase [Actinomycetes bacterium]
MNPEELLENLDEAQSVAAMALVGPVCILAGAGTGKTRTITHRLAYGIAKGQFAANRTLVLTYTNRAAGELRARLQQLGAGLVSVKTFHAAALSQLQHFWPQLTGALTPRVIESKARLLHEIAMREKIALNGDSIRDLAAEIEWRKQNLLSLEQYQDQLASRPAVSGLSAKKNFALQTAYENEKLKTQTIDWEDVLILMLGMLRAEASVREHVRSQYRFFTVDEYQDISALQHALLDEWLGERSDLCVVGDPNQTIFSFTGATNAFLLGFENRFENAQVFELLKNYRSTPQIVAFANRLTKDQNTISPLESDGKAGSVPRIREFQSLAEESAQVAAEIKKLRDSGTPAKDIAVLYRINGQSEQFENELTKLGVEYVVRGGQRFFQRPEIQSAIRVIRAEAAAGTDKKTFEAVADIIRSLGWSAKEPSDPNLREKWESLNSLLEIADELGETATLVELARELDERARSQHEPTRAAVTLATIHSAKGLEWPNVFIVGLTEGYLPISFAKSEAQIAEERRLLYVAVTRAEKQLNLSWAKHDPARELTRQRSRFLSLLDS